MVFSPMVWGRCLGPFRGGLNVLLCDFQTDCQDPLLCWFSKAVPNMLDVFSCELPGSGNQPTTAREWWSQRVFWVRQRFLSRLGYFLQNLFSLLIITTTTTIISIIIFIIISSGKGVGYLLNENQRGDWMAFLRSAYHHLWSVSIWGQWTLTNLSKLYLLSPLITPLALVRSNSHFLPWRLRNHHLCASAHVSLRHSPLLQKPPPLPSLCQTFEKPIWTSPGNCHFLPHVLLQGGFLSHCLHPLNPSHQACALNTINVQ